MEQKNEQLGHPMKLDEDSAEEEGLGTWVEPGSHLCQIEPTEEEGPGNWMESGIHKCRMEPGEKEGTRD